MKKYCTDILAILERGHIALVETILSEMESTKSPRLKRTVTELSSPALIASYKKPIPEAIACAYLPPERLILLGGGHIAKPVCEFASRTGFHVTVVDDRPKFANTRRFPEASQVLNLAYV